MNDASRAALRHFLADIFHTRIIDIGDSDIEAFLADLNKHGLVLVPTAVVIR